MTVLEKRMPRPLHESIDAVHEAIHEGGMYTISKSFLAVANDGIADIHIVVPAGYEAHLRLYVGAEGKANVKTYTGTTYTGAGTAITPFNRKSGLNGSTVTAFHTTTPNVLGTQRGDDLVFGGTTGSSVGGTFSSDFESIIAPSSDFLLRVQNKGSSAKDINIIFNYYLRAV